jgi:hypothetical protein
MRHPGSPCRPRPVHVLSWLYAAALLLSAPARAHNPDLSKPYPYTVGDAIAARMQGIFRIVAGLETSTLVYYDREAKNVIVEIEGDTDEVEGARREIQAFVQAIQEGVVGYVRKRHNFELTDRDVTLIYYSGGDQDLPVEVVRRENGVFIVPKPEESGNEEE